MRGLRSRWALAAFGALAGGDCLAQAQVEYFGLLAPQLGIVHHDFTLAPLSPIPYPNWDNPNVVGRFFGRFDVKPSYDLGDARVGLDAGIFSNLNTAYDRRRGIVPFDYVNTNLTRIRPETPLGFDRLQLFHESALGRFEAGWGNGVSDRLAVRAPTSWGLGSVAGDYPYFVDKPIDVGFVSVTALGSANTSPRAAYYTPPIFGVVAGLTYQPDTRNTGFDLHYGGREPGIIGRRANTDQPLFFEGQRINTGFVPSPTANGSFEAVTAGFTDVVEAGFRTTHTYFGDVLVQTSLGGITGTAVRSPLQTRFNDLTSFQAGIQVGYDGWSIGGGYVWAGDSGYTRDAHYRQRKNQYSIHGGIQYETGPWTFGAATLLSDDAGDPTERSDRQLHVYSAGMRYAFTPQLDVGAEVNYIRPLSADYGDQDVYQGLVQLRYRFDGVLR